MEDEDEEYIEHCFNDNLFLIDPTMNYHFHLLNEDQILYTTKVIELKNINSIVDNRENVDFKDRTNSLLEYNPYNCTIFNIEQIKENYFKLTFNQNAFERSYKDFQSLRNILILHYPGCIFPLIPSKRQFSIYYKQKDYELKQEEKLKIVEHFLNYIQGQPHIFDSDILKVFLDPYCLVQKNFELFNSPTKESYLYRYATHFFYYIGVEVPDNSISMIKQFINNLKSILDSLRQLADNISQLIYLINEEINYGNDVIAKIQEFQKSCFFLEKTNLIDFPLNKNKFKKLNFLLHYLENFYNKIFEFEDAFRQWKMMFSMLDKTNLSLLSAKSPKKITKRVLDEIENLKNVEEKLDFVYNVSTVHLLKFELEKFKRDTLSEYLDCIQISFKSS